MPASAGHHATLMMLWEDVFDEEDPSDTNHKALGADATLDTAEGSHNAVRVFEPSNREAVQIIEQNFSGSWSASFSLTNPWWLRTVIDEPSTSGSDAPYTHEFDGQIPSSFRFVQGTETTGVERYLRGCVTVDASISVDVMGSVDITLNGIYANEEKDPSASLEDQPTIEDRVLHFGHASLSLDGSMVRLVQSLDISINNNIDLVPELGTRMPVDYSPKERIVDLSWTDIVNDDDDHLDRFYGGSDTITETMDNEEDAVILFDNGLTGADKNSLQFSLDNLFPDSYGRTGIGDPTADLQGNLSSMTATVKATAENSTETAP